MSKSPKNKAAQEMVKLRNSKLSPERRREIAQKANRARWASWRENKVKK